MSVIKKVKSGAKMEDIVGYSRAVVVDNFVFVSNTAGRNPETGEMPDSFKEQAEFAIATICLLYTSPSPRDLSTSRMPSSA